jgi:N-acetylmuramoyl-L-alanine amidase
MKILIDNGHGSNTAGKCSPDKRLREYAWSRDCAKRLVAALKKKGYDAELITPEAWDVKLQTRVSRVNNICKAVGARNCLLVSIHNNAGGGDGKWHDACGWSVFVSKNASENSKKLARMLTVEAMKRELMGNRSVPLQKYWTWSWTDKDIYILKNTACPAVLTENMFQDHKGDVDYLLSEDGMKELVDLHFVSIINYIKSL